MTMTPLGDLAQSLLLRRSMAQTQLMLATATTDLAEGQASDPKTHLNGHTGPLLAIDSSLARNEALSAAIGLARTRTEVMQAALSRVDDAATEAARSLMSAAQSANLSTLKTTGELLQESLEVVVSALNQRHAGQAVFAGTAGDGAAIASAADILAAARQQTADAQTPTELVDDLTAWLDDPNGFAATLLPGNDDSVTLPLGISETVTLRVSAGDPLLRDTFRGLLLGGLLADDRFPSDSTAQSQLAQLAGETLYSAAQSRTDLAARLGLSESRIETAETRLAAETGALQIARNELLEIDLYAVSTALTETETRIETLYAITARLSRLTLAEYLR